jgi:peroxiredoxin
MGQPTFGRRDTYKAMWPDMETMEVVVVSFHLQAPKKRTCRDHGVEGVLMVCDPRHSEIYHIWEAKAR